MKYTPPWRRPIWIIYFIGAISFSIWLAMPQDNATNEVNRIILRFRPFVNLFGMVAVGAFLGNIAEGRCWHLLLATTIGWFAKGLRLPQVVGFAMPAAIFSHAAANGILANSYNAGEIDRSSLIVGGMATSYLAHTSHSLRVLYPVVAVVGIPGAIYFAGQLIGEFLFMLGVLFWNHRTQDDTLQSIRFTPEKALPWHKTLHSALIQTLGLLFRLTCITIPLALSVEWLVKQGIFDFWDKAVPDQISRLFPAEILSIVVAQIGGLIQSATLAADMRSSGLIDNPHIVLAMLTASAIGNPFRMLRRNLPSTLGLFPSSVAFIVVFGMQIARLCISLILLTLTICWIL